jgi:hypothetical protein
MVRRDAMRKTGPCYTSTACYTARRAETQTAREYTAAGCLSSMRAQSARCEGMFRARSQSTSLRRPIDGPGRSPSGAPRTVDLRHRRAVRGTPSWQGAGMGVLYRRPCCNATPGGSRRGGSPIKHGPPSKDRPYASTGNTRQRSRPTRNPA